MANILNANNSQILDRHQDSMMTSLARRLEIARATNNVQLVELLEQEKRQVAIPTPVQEKHPVWKDWFNTLKQGLTKAIAGSSKLEVCQFEDGSDRWWYAIDPRTGNCVYADSEAELRLWIKENYQGQ